MTHQIAGDGPTVKAVPVQLARSIHSERYVSNGEGDRAEGLADMRILNLVDKLNAKGVSEYCTGKAMIFIAAALCVKTMGSAKATAILTYLAEEVYELNIPTPDDQTHH